MRAAVLALTIAAFAAPAAASDYVPNGRTAAVRETIPACLKRQDEDKLLKLLIADDKEAALKLAARLFPSCRALDAGTVGTVEDNDHSLYLSCLRMRGDPDCFWLPQVGLSAR